MIAYSFKTVFWPRKGRAPRDMNPQQESGKVIHRTVLPTSWPWPYLQRALFACNADPIHFLSKLKMSKFVYPTFGLLIPESKRFSMPDGPSSIHLHSNYTALSSHSPQLIPTKNVHLYQFKQLNSLCSAMCELTCCWCCFNHFDKIVFWNSDI